MKYIYYPGCSLDATAKSYDESCRAIAKAVGLEMQELDDWNCCGSTIYFSMDKIVSYGLSARNLARAEAAGGDCVVCPCSACYLALKKTNDTYKKDLNVRRALNGAMKEIGAEYTGKIKVRHLLDVLVNDIPEERWAELVKKPLAGLKVATYYGCQIIRPKGEFDHHEDPVMFEKFLRILGAETVEFPYKVKCCGASQVGTNKDYALELINKILNSAQANGASCIATVCPLCNMNLEGFQKTINKKFGTSYSLPVYHFTQLLGVALNIAKNELGFKRGIIPDKGIFNAYYS